CRRGAALIPCNTEAPGRRPTPPPGTERTRRRSPRAQKRARIARRCGTPPCRSLRRLAGQVGDEARDRDARGPAELPVGQLDADPADVEVDERQAAALEPRRDVEERERELVPSRRIHGGEPV